MQPVARENDLEYIFKYFLNTTHTEGEEKPDSHGTAEVCEETSF